MTGLLLLTVFVCWILSLGWFIKIIGTLLPTSKWNKFVKLLVFSLLLPLPLIDEIIAKPKFEALCRDKAVITVDANKAKGHTVYLMPTRLEDVRGLPIPIQVQRWLYADVQSREVLVSSNSFQATGGWLIRLLGISETNAPLTFNGYCHPEDDRPLFKQLNIQYVERSVDSPKAIK